MPYPMPPGLRIPYDSDGTVGILRSKPSTLVNMVDIHPNALRAMNSTVGGGMFVGTDHWERSDLTTSSSSEGTGAFFALLFPLPTRLRGIFLSAARATNPQTPNATYASDTQRVETSQNSTNGVDGDWNFVGNLVRGATLVTGKTGISVVHATSGAELIPEVDTRNVKDYYRKLKAESGVGIEDLSGAAMRNVVAIRVWPHAQDSGLAQQNYAHGNFHLHLYGEPDSEASDKEYLQGWRSTSDMRLGAATLSWGDLPLGSSSDKTFRIKNHSDTKTAVNVVVSVEDPMFYPTPSPASQILFSLDGGISWSASVTLAGIGPNTVSGNILMRRVTPTDAPLSSWSPKVRFDAESWT